jgi:autotransporter-associated beta strand protein
MLLATERVTARCYSKGCAKSIRRLRRRKLVPLAAIAASTLVASRGNAQTWTGLAGDNSWSNPVNWNPQSVPGAGSTADITTTGAAGVTATYDYTGPAITLNTLNIGLAGGASGATDTLSMSANNLTAITENIGDSGNGTFTQYGGDDTTSGNFGVGINSTDTGTYNQNGGTLSVGGRYYVGYNGTGTVNQTNGNISIANNFDLFVGYSSTATGIYNLGGGTLATSGDANGGDGDELIGDSGSATFTQTDGTNTVGGEASMWVAAGTGKSAMYFLSGGTLNVPYLNLSQTSGTGNGTLTISGTGVANISESITGYNNSTLVLSGGLLNIEANGIASAANPITTVELPAPGQTAGIQSLGGAGINGAGLDMNGGGTLLLIGANNSYSGGTTIATGSTIQVGGPGGAYSTIGSIPAVGNIDDEGTLQFSQSNNITLSGAVSGAGTVIEDSSGATTLSGINTYSGQTTVNLGTLAVNGELYHGVNSAPSVNVSGGTLAGTGTIHSGITLNSGTIAPGLAGSTLSADGGLAASGGTLQFDVGTSTASELALGGIAGFSGGVNVDFTLSGAPTSGSIFTILTSTGLSGAGSLNLTPTVIGTDTLTPSVSGNDLIVTVSGGGGLPSSLSWDNAGAPMPISDGVTWNFSKANWNNGSSPTTYADGDAVTFNDTNNGHYQVTLNTTVKPASVLVNNTSGNYSISGAGVIIDTGSFIKKGAGLLTLGTGLNAASLSIFSGTVKLATNTTLGSGNPTSNVNISSPAILLTGQLDITNNHIIIDYGASDPIATIVGYLRSGFHNGAWNGPGIISSQIPIANANSNSPQYGIGFSDGNDKINGHSIVTGLSSGQIELKYTLLGDANLDGTVNGADFSILAANFGQGYTNWDQGNFLFTPAVNGADFSALAHNFGQGDSGADVAISPADIAALDSFAIANGLPLPTFAAVPEPASAGTIVMAGLGILCRRRRSSTSA